MEKIKLNLGCGNDIKEGWVNVDIHNFGQEVIWDLDRVPYPFDGNSAEVILMQDIIEHLKSPKLVLKEIYRIASDGCTLVIRTPHPKSPNWKKDKEHISPIYPEFLQKFDVFSCDVVYYHCQKGLFHYWNQLAIIRVKK